MSFTQISSWGDIGDKLSSQGLRVYGDNIPVLIADAGAVKGYRILRRIVATGVRVSVTGNYLGAAEKEAEYLAALWFANQAISLGGNAVINFRRSRYRPSEYFDREDRTTDYDCDCTFTGKIVEVQTQLKLAVN